MSIDWIIDNIIWIALWYLIVFGMGVRLLSQNMQLSMLSKMDAMTNRKQEWKTGQRQKKIL